MPKIKDMILRGALNIALADKARTFEVVRKDYDANWFLRFLQLADEEDWADGTGGRGDAYDTLAWVNIAVEKIAKNLARAPFEIYEGDDPARTNNPALKLFTGVNPYMSRYQLWEATVSWLLVRGECIWIFEQGHSAQEFPTEIWIFDPRMFEHTVDNQARRITMWRYRDRSKRIDIPFLPDELIHFKLWNKLDVFRGRNPLFALGTEIEHETLAEQWNTSLLKNRSTPPGILSSDKPLSEEQAKSVLKMWEKQHRGASKAHRIAVLGYGMDYKKISLSPAELEFMQLRKWNRQTVLAKYGVPPAVAGIKDEATPLSGKDTNEQLSMFWRLTLMPMIRFFEDKLKTDFFLHYTEMKRTNTIGKFELDGIPELQEDEDKKVERQVQQTKEGHYTINEIRRANGDDPVPWGDTWWMPLNLIPAGEAGNNKPEKPEERNVTPSKRAIEKLWTPAKRNFYPEYSEQYKTAHWTKVVKGWEGIEKDFIKAIRGWMYESRSETLSMFADVWTEGAYYEAIEHLSDSAYWEGRGELFATLTEPQMMRAMDLTGKVLNELFTELGIQVEPVFNIYDTGAINRLQFRVTKVKNLVSETMRNQVRGVLEVGVKEGRTTAEIADGIRHVFNVGQNRSTAIARTELGGVVNDSRIEGFLSEGFLYHEWLSSRDVKVRPEHTIDGEIVKIGEMFSNLLLYPNDPGGDAGNVINCRCLTLPVKEAPEY